MLYEVITELSVDRYTPVSHAAEVVKMLCCLTRTYTFALHPALTSLNLDRLPPRITSYNVCYTKLLRYG